MQGLATAAEQGPSSSDVRRPREHEDHSGHGGHDHSSHADQYRRLFWIMLALGVPVVLASPMFASLVGYEVPDGLTWIAPFSALLMYVWGGARLPRRRDRRDPCAPSRHDAARRAGDQSPSSPRPPATLGLLHHDLEFWWEMALLIVIMLLGHWLEMKSLAQTSSALDSLAALLPDEAEKVVGNEIATVPPADLEVGDVVHRPPGRARARTGRSSAGGLDGRINDHRRIPRRCRGYVGEQVVADTVATNSRRIRVEISAPSG